MKRAPDPAAALAGEVARASSRPGAARTLLLDLDGTLAPIAPTPEEARVPNAVLEDLRRLLRLGWTLAIVSGRPAAQVRRMVPVRGVRIFGSHGLEGARGSRPTLAMRRLARMRRPAAEVVRRFPGARLEVKPAGIAFHDRKVPVRTLAEMRRRIRLFLASQDLEGIDVLRGRRVVELRPAGHHKGMVIRWLALPRDSDRRDASLVALGDDRTDEDLFREIRGRGLPVRVGRPRKGTLAERRLASPRAVQRFLRALGERVESALVRAPRPRRARRRGAAHS